ncbi:MAG TPA: hypothetical protein VFX59_18865 [Polyangiales bacterium]|nr:hypothetical protein [Polyangiales bacterium]
MHSRLDEGLLRRIAEITGGSCSSPVAPVVAPEAGLQVESLQHGGVPRWVWPTTIALLACALFGSLYGSTL